MDTSVGALGRKTGSIAVNTIVSEVIAKNAVDDMNGDITPDDATNNVEMKKADLLPQLSAIIPNSKAPINIPTMYSALNIPFRNFLSQTKLC